MVAKTARAEARFSAWMWMLEELNSPTLSYRRKTHSPKALGQPTPSGNDPCTAGRGRVLTDSDAILDYLADQHAN